MRKIAPVLVWMLLIAIAQIGLAADPISSIQTDRLDGAILLDDISNVTRVSVGGLQYRDFILPSAVGGYNPGTDLLYEGDNSSANPATIADALVGNVDITTGTLNVPSGNPVNVIFSSPVSDVAGQHEVFIMDVTANDVWSVTAITGGTAAAPVLGGSTTYDTNGTDIGLNMEINRANGGALNGPYNIGAFGVDILGDLGEANIIGVQVATSGGSTADPSVVIASSGTVSDGLTGASMSNTGNLTSVTTIERGTIDAADLVGVDLFHFSSDGSDTRTVATPNGDPGVGNRASLVEDLALNTGLINPGGNSPGTLTPAQQAALGPNSSSSNGLGVNFDGGLINGPGIDLVVFEIATQGLEEPPDAFMVNRVDGVQGSLLVTPGDYTVELLNVAGDLISPGDSSTLNGLETSAFATAGTFDQEVAGVGIDLSDLGYSDLEVAPGLLFSDAPGGGNVDIMLVTGLPTAAIPEPTSIALWSLLGVMGLIGFLRIRQRGQI